MKHLETTSFEKSKECEIYKPQRQLLLMMLGLPGSGKSFFARQLAETLDFDHISSDAIRTELFGRPDVHIFDKMGQPTSTAVAQKLDEEVFKLLNQRVKESLSFGRSVVRDHIHHRLKVRERSMRQANFVGALPIMIWIKTPPDLAHRRGLSRKATTDQINERCPDSLQKRIDYWQEAIDLPSDKEMCIQIDGSLNFTQQLESFTATCQQLERELKID